ncbi:MAG TPA: hypothetical protein VGJ73_11040 [Verrucomicrobiae bacterium]|jgi:hypothetical protein
MYIHRKSQPVSAGWIVAAGVLLLLISFYLLYMVVDALVTGEIIKLSRVDPGVITRADNPSEFWVSEIFFSYFIVLLTVLAVRGFKTALKRRKK